jgi:uncharacterized membrane protein
VEERRRAQEPADGARDGRADALTTSASSRRVSRLLRNHFLGGLVVLVPIVLTLKALTWLFSFLDHFSRPWVEALFQRPIPGVGVVLTIAVVFLAGFVFSLGPLRRLLESIDELVDSVPLVGSVYGTTKKVLSGFGSPGGERAFQRFVLARLPGRTTPGFLMRTFTLAMKDGQSFDVATVYVPTNHLYVGDVVVLPIEDVVETDMSVEDGVSLILSAGASAPALVRQRS